MQSTCHDRYSDTMAVVSREILARAAAGARVLDIPAGAGRLGDSLREHGLTVVGADINGARPDTVMADMTRALPFRDGEFDVVVCMEGIEHIDNYHGLIGELARVTRPGGTLILTMPNIACLYSRLMFMCTGSFFQFWPTQFRVNVDGETLFDYGHITPLTWQKVAFHFAHHGVRLAALFPRPLGLRAEPASVPVRAPGAPDAARQRPGALRKGTAWTAPSAVRAATFPARRAPPVTAPGWLWATVLPSGAS